MIVDEFVTLLSFDADVSDGKTFDNLVNKLESHVTALSVSVTAAVTAVEYFAEAAANHLAENVRWANSIGASTDSIQKLGHAAHLVGGNVDDLRGDIEKMAPIAARTGESLEDLFGEQADRVEGMDAAASHTVLAMAGYSETMIKIIQQGRAHMKEAKAGTVIVPPDQLKAALEFSKVWKRMSAMIDEVAYAAVASALPAFHDMIVSLQEFIEDNKELIASGVGGFFKAVGFSVKLLFEPLSLLLKILGPFIRFLDKITGGLIPVTAGVVGLSAALTIMAAVAVKNAILGLASLANMLWKVLIALNTSLIALAAFIERIIAVGFAQAIANSEMWAAVVAYNAKIAAELKDLAVGSKMLLQMGAQAISMGVLAVATGIATFSLTAAATASWAFTASLLANPITWVVVAVVALVAALAAVVIYWKQIAAFFKWAKEGKTGLAMIARGLTSMLMQLSLIYYHWEQIVKIVHLAIAAFGWIGKVMKAAFSGGELETIMNAVLMTTRAIGDVWNGISDSIKKSVEWASKIPFLKKGVEELMAFESGGGPNNNVTAPASSINNSRQSASVTNNISINAGNATSPGAIANYLKQTNVLQGLGFGSAGGW